MSFINKTFDFLENKIQLVNDIKNIDRGSVEQKILLNSQASISFIILLMSATIVCSLGLLLDSPPVIIGGMLISPLMWPLSKLSLGVASGNKDTLLQAFKLLIMSIFIAVFSSFIITLYSPVKHMSNEILSRTSPTILDIVIAVAAGMIAVLALIEKKISDSLAGVAIATSLMPPLCVSGIGLALHNYQVATGGFVLFIANVVSIIFVSTLIFSGIGFANRATVKLRNRGLATITFILIITALPLAYYLKDYSFQNSVYDNSKNIIEESFKQVSLNTKVQNIKTDVKHEKSGTIIFIEANVIVPEDIVIDYQQQDEIIGKLETALKTKVNLSLNIQRAISIVSAEKEHDSVIKSQIIEALKQNILSKDAIIKISAVDVTKLKESWKVETVLRINPSNTFTTKDKDILQSEIEKTIGSKINLDITLVPIIKLKANQEDQLENLKNDISDMLLKVIPEADIRSINLISASQSITEDSPKISVICKVLIGLPSNTILDKRKMLEEKKKIEELYKTEIDLEISTYQTKVEFF